MEKNKKIIESTLHEIKMGKKMQLNPERTILIIQYYPEKA
jgi:hypothetical protein